MKVISGRSHPIFAKTLADLIRAEYSEVSIENFQDGELRVQIFGDFYKENVIIVQSISHPANDNLMELLMLTDACRRAGAERIIAVIPYFGYSRQDRKSYDHGPITVSLIANLLEASGVNVLISVDLHSEQIGGFFKIDVQNLEPITLFLPFIRSSKNCVIVSPDAGGVTRAKKVSSFLEVDLAIINKMRSRHNECYMNEIIGSIKNKHCLLIDDIIDTGGTICKAANLLIEQGALSVDAYVTHGVLSGESQNLIERSNLRRIYITDTIKNIELSSKFHLVSVKKLIAESLINY